MLPPVVKIPAILEVKKPAMHLPEFALFSGALGCRGGSKCVGMMVFERKIAEDKFNATPSYVLSLDLWQCLVRETSAKRALIISKFDQREPCVVIAFEVSTIKIDGLGKAYSHVEK